jgi:hypothetical protein
MVTIPTTSPTEGSKEATYTYALHTPKDGYTLYRNYIYTLDIKVRGQSLDPVITVSVLPWNDVSVDGNIYGTYLTVDKSEILFDASGEANINFCTDAQAVYFDFVEFNNSNPVKIGSEVLLVGIDTTKGVNPDGFKSGQILLDQQHCGSFGFKLDLNKFPEFPAINFSGKICMKAGNIVKCLTFPATRVYDAHFIVGDSIFGLDSTYTSATVYRDPGDNTDWLKISENRKYNATDMKDSYSNSTPQKLYLHLDENLTGSIRTGIVTVISNGVEKKLKISQLPAIPVGRFGYVNSVTDDNSIFSSTLYTEQLYEFKTMPPYITSGDVSTISVNAIYNGRRTATSSAFNMGSYNNFNYQQAAFQAINYCAHKNRITGSTLTDSDLKWYLPSQAQLLGMWLSYTSYKDIATSNFKYSDGTAADLFWSSTDNNDYSNYAQFMDFRFGNLGHYAREKKLWARCVRNSTASSASESMILTTNGYPIIDFGKGMPAGSYNNTTSKGDGGGDELSNNNNTLYKTLRVAVNDQATGVAWSLNACDGYSETGAPANTWRLPTQRELQAIWILQSEIKDKLSAFTLLANDYYWSATDAARTSNTNAWIIYGSRTEPGSSGNAPNHHKITERHRVRCVWEVP